MAMHRPLETDGVPAPSDFELAAADRARYSWDAKITFDEFVCDIGLTWEREAFHEYITDEGLNGTQQTRSIWWTWYGKMRLRDANIRAVYRADTNAAAKDQADTQNDALT